MQQLIEKRKHYFAELDSLNREIDAKAEEYFNNRVEEIRQETQNYRNEIVEQNKDKFEAINSKIKIIDEIISEEMPEAKEINFLFNQAEQRIAKEVKEEVKEDIPTEDNTNTTPVEVAEKDIISVEATNEVPENTNIVECVEILPEEQKVEVVEEPVVERDHIEGVATLSEPDAEGFQEFIAPEGYEGEEVKPVVEEAIIEEEPIVEETQPEEIIEEQVKEEIPVKIESRPGMPEILNPR